VEDDDHGFIVDPGLIVMVGGGPECGRACLPIGEYAPLVERICELETIVEDLRERLAQIWRMADR
jgi:hypothetical protein